MPESPSAVITKNQSQKALMLSSKVKDVYLRRQAYNDFTAAMYLIDYMQNIGLRANIQRSVFKSSKIYSDFRFVDLYCNSHMLYVITVNQREAIKIPAIHKEYDILPEGYIVVELNSFAKQVRIKGVIYPNGTENKEKEGEYFVFGEEELTDAETFFEKLRKYAGIKSSIGRHLECINLFVPYMDDKLNSEEKKTLIKHILTCETCKKKLMDALEFDTNSKSIENHTEIISKEDLSTKEKFLNKIKTNSLHNSNELQGVIDVIYNEDEMSKIKEGGFKYSSQIQDLSPKTKKLIALSISVFVILVLITLVASSFLPNSNKNSKKSVQGVALTQQVKSENTNIDAPLTNYQVNVPNLRKSTKGYTSISKVSWEAPKNSTKEEQKRFLQSAGKSIRLNLQNDLLLSNEVALNNKVKFDIRFLRDGSLDDITILDSSGTDAVDEIIKQSVQNTLYYMRPPKGSFVGKNNSLTLIIDF